MPKGHVLLELVVDVPANEVAATKKDYESEGYLVIAMKQDSGTFAVAAAKYDED